MASSAPATSAKVTEGVSFDTSFARDFPNCMMRDPPPCMLESKNQKIKPMMTKGSMSPKRDTNQLVWGTSSVNSPTSELATAAMISSPRGAT